MATTAPLVATTPSDDRAAAAGAGAGLSAVAAGAAAAAAAAAADDDDDDDDEAEEEEEAEEEAFDDKPQRVADGLFIGPLAAERDLSALKSRGITHVLAVAAEARDGGSGDSDDASAIPAPFPSHPRDLSYLILPIEDREDEDIVAHFPAAFAFLDEAAAAARQGAGDDDDQQHQQAAAARAFGGGGALVACVAGVSRSASVVIGWLMSQSRGRGRGEGGLGLDCDAALSLLRDVRPWVAPNPGFEAQLRRFEALGADASRWRGWEVERKAAAEGG